MPRVSVCIATYNGFPFLRAQLDSILSQVTENDEVIICDDGSTDSTGQLISEYRDTRIRFYRNEVRLGHVQNFSRAISLASGDFIALSDQDDIWAKSRLDTMIKVLKPLSTYSLVVGESTEIDEGGNVYRRPARGRELGRSPSNMFAYLVRIFLGRVKILGCTFLFRRELVPLILPIPAKVEAHDIWIAMNACVFGRVAHCQESTLFRRIHYGNLTPPRRRGLMTILKSRSAYLFYLLLRLAKYSTRNLRRPVPVDSR